MAIEVPVIISVTFIFMILFTGICTTCLVIDTIVKLKEYIDSKKQYVIMWGESTVDKKDLGTSEE